LLVPCEVAVKCVLPAIRSMIAKELTTKYELKQTEAAKLLGLSQSAVSLYSSKMRGRAIDLEKDEDVTKLVGNITNALIENDGVSYNDFVNSFCEICRIVRGKGLMCKLHKEFDPNIDIENCRFCSIVASLCYKP
jgi:predicted transcriptional regulator